MPAAERLQETGNRLYSKKDYKNATFFYKLALVADPNDRSPKKAPLHNNLAQSLLKQKKFEEAESHAERAIKLDVDTEKGYYRAAKAAEGQSDYDKAEKYLKLGLGRKKLAQNSDLLRFKSELEKKMDIINQCSYDSEVRKEENLRPKNKTTANKVDPQVQAIKMPSVQPAAMKRPVETGNGKRDLFLQLSHECVKENVSLSQQKLRRKKTDYEEAVREAAELLLKKKQNITAALKYQEALDIVMEYPAESIGLPSLTETVLKFCIVLCWCKSHHVNLEQMSRSIEYMTKIRKVHTPERFPAVFYGYAKVYSKLNRFNRAKELALGGLEVLLKLPMVQVHCWPGSKIEIHETSQFGLEECLRAVIAECSVYHPPDATCKNSKDDCLRLSKQIIPSQLIFYSDVDFHGFMEIHCQSKCVIEYHISCWRDFKDKQSEIHGNKLTDKDILGLECPTDDCFVEAGIRSVITYIAQIVDDRHIKFSVSKEIAKEKAPKKKIESTKPSTPTKAIAVAKPKVGVRAQPVDKVPGKGAGMADFDGCTADGTVDSQALSVGIENFLELRKKNFNYRKSQIWDITKPFYGRTDLLPHEFFRTPRKADARRDYVLTWFRETIGQRTSMPVAEVEELWSDSFEDIPAFMELELNENFPGIVKYLAESYRFVVIGDTMCLAEHLDTVFATCRTDTTEGVQFLIEDDARKWATLQASGSGSNSSERSSAVSLPIEEQDHKDSEKQIGKHTRSRLDSARSIFSAFSDDGGAKCLELLCETEVKAESTVTPSKRARRRKAKSELLLNGDSKKNEMDIPETVNKVAQTIEKSGVKNKQPTVGLLKENDLASLASAAKAVNTNAVDSGSAVVNLPTAKTPIKKKQKFELAFDKILGDNKQAISSESTCADTTVSENAKPFILNVASSQNDGSKKSDAVGNLKAAKASGKKKSTETCVEFLHSDPCPAKSTADCRRSLSFDEPMSDNHALTESIVKAPKKTPKKKKVESKFIPGASEAMIQIDHPPWILPPEPIDKISSSLTLAQPPDTTIEPEDKINVKYSKEVLEGAEQEGTKHTVDTEVINVTPAVKKSNELLSMPYVQENLVAETKFKDAGVMTESGADNWTEKPMSHKSTGTTIEEFVFGVQCDDKPQVVDGASQTDLRASAIAATDAKVVVLAKENELMHQRVKNSDEFTAILLAGRKDLELKISELEASNANKDEEVARMAKSTAATKVEKKENLLLQKANSDLENSNQEMREELSSLAHAHGEMVTQVQAAENKVLALSQQLERAKEQVKSYESILKTESDNINVMIQNLTENKKAMDTMRAEYFRLKESHDNLATLHKGASDSVVKLTKEKAKWKAEVDRNAIAAREMPLLVEALREEAATLRAERDMFGKRLDEKMSDAKKPSGELAKVTEALAASRAELEAAKLANKQLESQLMAKQEGKEAQAAGPNRSVGGRPVETDPSLLFENFVLIHKDLWQIKADQCETEFARVLKLLDDAQENPLVAEEKKQTLWEMRAVLGEIYERLLKDNGKNISVYKEFLNNPGKVGRIEDLPLIPAVMITDEVYAALVDIDENCRQESAEPQALPKPAGPSAEDRRSSSHLLALQNAPNKFMSRLPPPPLTPKQQPMVSGASYNQGFPPGYPHGYQHGFHQGFPRGYMPPPQPGRNDFYPAVQGMPGAMPFPMPMGPPMNGANPLQGAPVYSSQGAVSMGPNFVHVLNRTNPPGPPQPAVGGARPKRSVSQSSANSVDSDHSQRIVSKMDEARKGAASTLNKPTEPPTRVGITLNKMSVSSCSYESLMNILADRFPNSSTTELNECLAEIRLGNNGSLKGYTPPTIVKKVKEVLQSKSQKPAWAPVAGDGAGAKWRNPLDESECAICMDPMSPSSTTTLPCDHIFHAKCIKKWLLINSVCPTCKRYTKMDDEYPPLK